MAQVVVNVYKRNEAELNGEKSVAAVVDHGQEVRYHQKINSYMASANDDELFNGFERLLAPYRRIHVITS